MPGGTWSRGAFWTAVLTALAVCLFPACGDRSPPTPTRPHISSDSGRAIVEWILVLPFDQGPLFLPVQAAIVASASPASRFRIVYSQQQVRRDFRRELHRRGFSAWERLTWIQEQGPLAPWARDLFVMGEDERAGPLYFLHDPAHYELMRSVRGLPDTATPRVIRRVVGSRGYPTWARLEGGCVVADDDTVFVSTRDLEILVHLGEARDLSQAREMMHLLYGRRVVDIPSPSIRPFDHCDLRLTALGKGRVVLADPALGRRLLATVSRRDREIFRGRVRVLAAAAASDPNVAGLDRRDILAECEQALAMPGVDASFTDTARRLACMGYEVTRVPWLSVDGRRAGLNPVFSYNNVVLEDGPDGPIVYLPTYGLPPLDRAAERAWRALGYTLRLIPALGPGLRGGAVRCLTQTIRSPAANT